MEPCTTHDISESTFVEILTIRLTTLAARFVLQGLQAKQKIAALKPAFEPGQQKLIHSGKVLKDDEPISVAGVKEGSFLVCMVTKPKAVRIHDACDIALTAMIPSAPPQ